MIEIIKNCKEKGAREEEIGSNPHSKGIIFSILILFLNEIKIDIFKIIIVIKIIIIKINIKLKIK